MEELFDTLLHHARGLWRFRWQSILVAWLVCGLGWVYVLNLPNIYQSSARVYVDTRTALRPVLEGIAVDQDLESEIYRVRQALLSRPQLEKVARQAHLDTNVHSKPELFALIDRLRNSISISTEQRSSDSVYAISYQHSNPKTSLTVVQALVRTFVDDTLLGKREGSEGAQTFLKEQLQNYQARLIAGEEKLATFKRDKLGLLPGASGDYFTRLNTEMAAEKQAESNLAIAYGRRAELSRQLSTARPYVPGTNAAASTSAAAGSSDVSIRRLEAEAKIQELLLRFTEKHPEVIALQATVRELKQREQNELADLARGGQGTGAIRSLSANPVYQNIQVQLNQTDVEISALKAAVARHRSEITELRKVVDMAPAVEQQLAQLTRDYEVTKAQYTSLLQRLEKARVTDDADRTGIMKFDVIDPPAADPQPVSPPRFLMMLAVLVTGIGAGAGWGLLRQVVHPTFTSAQALAKETGLPVLGVISAFVSDEISAAQKLDTRRLALVGMSLVGVALLLAVFSDGVHRVLH